MNQLIRNQFITIFVVLTLIGCTTQTEVNLFAKYLDDKQLNKITQKIESADYKLTVNYLPFPETISNNLLVYMPSDNSNSQVYGLMDLLEGLNYKISSVNLAKVGNHRFTTNHIGIYLLPDGFIPAKENTYMGIVNNYGSVTCPNNLSLNEDKSFRIETEIWNTNKQDYDIELTIGTWLVNKDDFIVLDSPDWKSKLTFKRRLSIEASLENNIQKVSLIPQYNISQSGPYSKPDNKHVNVNCTYELSMVI